MNRPKILHVGGVLYWTIRTRNPDTQVLKDADSTPTVVVRKNGAATGDSVTVTKRSATTGIYDCSYNPAGEVEGDEFTIEESATVTGTTTSQATYSVSWEFTAIAVERGTDGALKPKTAGRDIEVAATTGAVVLDSASRAAILTEQLIESYAADGASPTVAQALMMILQHHQQKSVSGTTVTIKKLDKSTTASTYTLDNATDPTSITRAS